MVRQSRIWRLKLVNYPALPSSSGRFTRNTIDNPKNENWKVVEAEFGFGTSKEKVEKVQEEEIKEKVGESEKEENRNQCNEEERGVTLD